MNIKINYKPLNNKKGNDTMLKRITAFFLSICLTVFLFPMNAFAEAGDWDPLTDPDKVLGTMVGSKTFSSSTTIELGQDGYLRTMPTLDSGNYSYNAMAYCGATAKSNNTNIVQVKSIEIGTWQGGVWDGADALQVTVTPQSVGTTVIVINYYYTFSQHATPFNNPNAQWFYATVNYTVTVKNSSTPPAETTYVLKYDANGGNNAPTSQSASSTATSYTFNISAAKPTKDNYTFLGWADSIDAITATYQPEGQITLQKSSPTKTLYAVWKENPPATTYTVTYTDGVDGEEVFPDQVYSNLTSGDATPAFVGTPTRSGYTFKGWNPTVAATVTGNATYTAIWEEMNSNPTPELPELPYWPSIEEPDDNEEELDDDEVPLVPGVDGDTVGETEEAILVTSPDGGHTENVDDESVPQVNTAPQTGSTTAGNFVLLAGSALIVIAIRRKK